MAENLLRGERVEYIELRDQRGVMVGTRDERKHCTHVLALAGDTAAQWQAFDATLRNQIRKAERAGFTVRWGALAVRLWKRLPLPVARVLGEPIRRRFPELL